MKQKITYWDKAQHRRQAGRGESPQSSNTDFQWLPLSAKDLVVIVRSLSSYATVIKSAWDMGTPGPTPRDVPTIVTRVKEMEELVERLTPYLDTDNDYTK